MEALLDVFSKMMTAFEGELGHATMFLLGLLSTGLIACGGVVRSFRGLVAWRVRRREAIKAAALKAELEAEEMRAECDRANRKFKEEQEKIDQQLLIKEEAERTRLRKEATSVNGKPLDDFNRLKAIALADALTKKRRDAAYHALNSKNPSEVLAHKEELAKLTQEFRTLAPDVYPAVWQSGRVTGAVYEEIHRILGGEMVFDPIHASLILARVDETVTKST